MFSSDEVYAAYDRIASAAVNERPQLEQCFGMKCNVHGILHDPVTRKLVKPIEHMLRDPMHVLVSNGVANVHIAHLFQKLYQFKKNGKWLQLATEFLLEFTLPHKHGKPAAEWLARGRFGKKIESFASFAGIMLSLIPIIENWLSHIIPEDHELYQHKVCFTLLSHVVGICFMGPEAAVPHLEVLKQLIPSYVSMYTRLYPDAPTPKLHQMFHLTDHISNVQKLLSCFVTERKHRATKRAALFVFRHIDNTVIKDMINKQCEAISGESESLFSETSLVSPRIIANAHVDLYTSKEAVLSCGQVRCGDIVYLSTRAVGKVEAFFKCQDSLVAQIDLYQYLADDRWTTSSPEVQFCSCADIVDCVVYSVMGESIFVIRPFRIQLDDLISA